MSGLLAGWPQHRKILLGLGGLALALAVIGWLGLSGRLPGQTSTPQASAALPTPTAEELAAQNDHDSISSWVAGCIGVPSVHSLPSELLVSFNTATYFLYVNDKTIEPSRRIFNQQEQEVVALSKILYAQRINLSNTISDTSSAARTLQWLIILIGFATTAVVSISSTEIWKVDTKFGKAIRILAVTLPALGTAAAAVNAFYPRDELARASAFLTNLGQLHDRIAVEVWHMQCIASASVDPKSLADAKNPAALNAVTIVAWEKREQEILNPPQATSTASSSTEPSQEGKTAPVKSNPPKPGG